MDHRHINAPHVQRRVALAEGFMRSLWPGGEHEYLANHTRSFLDGSIRSQVPKPGFGGDDTNERRERLAEVLADIAEGLRDQITIDKEPF